jgi:hypothetical protein
MISVLADVVTTTLFAPVAGATRYHNETPYESSNPVKEVEAQSVRFTLLYLTEEMEAEVLLCVTPTIKILSEPETVWLKVNELELLVVFAELALSKAIAPLMVNEKKML